VTIMHGPREHTRPALPAHDDARGPAVAAEAGAVPHAVLTWTDPVTGAVGHLVVHTLVGGIATGGTRMRAGCTVGEVADLARGMAVKTAAFGLPVGGAKGGIDFDPKDPRATGVLERFCTAMFPWLDRHWVTAEDLGVPQHVIDDVFARLGLQQSFHAAIQRSDDPARTLRRVHAGLATRTADGLLLGDVIGGYGVAQAALGVLTAMRWVPGETTAAIQGVGTMGGGAAWYLHRAGVRVVAVADAAGTLFRAGGLDVPALLALRDRYGEIDRSGVPGDVERLPRDAVLALPVDVLVPGAVSYAIDAAGVGHVRARVVVEAANSATTAEAEELLTLRGIPVVPDFVANAGAAAWAWWLLQGQVGTDPEESFARLRSEMQVKVAHLLEEWRLRREPPRRTAERLADANRRALTGVELTIP